MLEERETEKYVGYHLPDSIKQFLKVSDDSTYCLESYAVPKTDKLINNLEIIEKKAVQLESNVTKYSSKLENLIEENIYNQNLEELRSENAPHFDDILDISGKSSTRDSISCEDMIDISSSDNVLDINDPFLSIQVIENEDEQSYIVTSSLTQSDTSSSDTSISDRFLIQQLDGSEDWFGLAGIQCESNVLCAIINIFRNFEDAWGMLESHTLCLEPHSENNVRCMFCHIRSIALRVNRAKLKVKLKPLEILSQLDQYHSCNDNFPSMMNKTFELLTACEPNFSKLLLKTLVCRSSA